MNEYAMEMQEQVSGLNRSKAEEAFNLVNQKRVENGMAALPWNEAYYELACVRAQEIVEKFSHERPDGTIVTDTHRLGENLATAQTIPRVVTMWMESDGHRQNILDVRHTNSVMACYEQNGNIYLCQLFE